MNKKITTKLLGMIILIGCIVGIPMFFLAHSKPVQYVEAAGSSLDVLGYAWSWHPHEQDAAQISQTPTVFSSSQTGTQGFGWISMSGTNQNSGGGSYQVTLDPTTGKFSGYAWSENGGWVNFAPTGQYPSVAGTTPQSAFVDPACLAVKTRTCPVKGWIRFVEGTSGNSSWDGWVNMEIFNTATAASVYFGATATGKGVQLLPESNGYRPMDGYAWGDDLVGVVGFSKAKVQVQPVDVCPNIPGDQSTPPATMIIDTSGNCVPQQPDVCPDTKFDVHPRNPKAPLNGTNDPKTAGAQTQIPAGYSILVMGNNNPYGPRPTYSVNGDNRPISYGWNGNNEGQPTICGIPGCTMPGKPHYNPLATIDNGTCKPCPLPNSFTSGSDWGTVLPDGTIDCTPLQPPIIFCPDGSIPPNGDLAQCPGSTGACTTDSPTYNPIFKDCRECHPGVTGYNTTTGLCEVTPPVECDSTSPDYNPITKDCRTCHPGVAGYNDKTGRCTIPGGHKTPIYIET